jgi:hypothetical protein
MTLIYEDRSSYNADIDSVGIINLRIECNPGQINSVIDFLAGVEGKAGVYHASFEVVKLTAVKNGTDNVPAILGMDNGSAGSLGDNGTGSNTAILLGDGAGTGVVSNISDSTGTVVDSAGQDKPIPDAIDNTIGEQDAERLQPDTKQEYAEPDAVQGSVRSVTEEGATPEVGLANEDVRVSGIAGASTEEGSVVGSA